ncbi:hypothetical protein T459_00915 [Capsicum annuum]|uniref:Phosphatidylinositol-glycan biosynthesis class X protein n=1 Tax=Capsicum annuum TaxID=4072 RepID=A0A2G3AFR8_CAPAN|nr:hypothetical protein T459_00915 [Capsicum annuum]
MVNFSFSSGTKIKSLQGPFIVFGNSQGLPLAGYWLEKIARWLETFVGYKILNPNLEDKVLIGDESFVRNSAKVEDRFGNMYPSPNKFGAMISVLFYPNLEDTILFQDGGIVVNQADFVRAYGLEVVIGADSVGIVELTKMLESFIWGSKPNYQLIRLDLGVTMELHDLLPQCLAMIITVMLIARISSCLDTAGLSEVHAPYLDNYVAKSYFSKHDNLIDSKFEDFIAHDILSSGCISLQGNVEFPPKLTFLHRKLIGEGSHRRLSSSLRLKMSSESFSRSSKSFEVIIVERLPSGVFADPFELQHLVQRGVFTDATVFGDTNLELPSFLSNRSLVEVHLEVNSNLTTQWKHELELNMELPLHSRYQPLGHGFSRVEFASPDLFLRCNVEGKQHDTSCLFALDEQNAESNDGHPVWAVPCGNRAHTEIVSAFTFISAVVSAILIIIASIRYSDSTASNVLKQS